MHSANSLVLTCIYSLQYTNSYIIEFVCTNSYIFVGIWCHYHFFRDGIDYYCVMHVTGEGLFSQAKGWPERTPLPCMESYMDKILQLRKDYRLHDNTQMMVLLSLCTKDMNKYVSMYPEVWFVDCTAGTNRQRLPGCGRLDSLIADIKVSLILDWSGPTL
jgi:hypothetical protein